MSSTELMKHAEHCGAFSKPQLNHTGLLKAAFWCTSRCFRSSLNACSASADAKYCWLRGPAGDRVDDAADELLDRVLALGRADVAAEVLRDDDVGRLLRPGLRHLDAALLEDDLALLVADDGVAQLPFDLVERIDPGGREEPGKVQPRNRDRRGAPGARRRPGRFHLSSGCLLPGCRSRQLVPSAFLHASSASFRDETAPPSRGSRQISRLALMSGVLRATSRLPGFALTRQTASSLDCWPVSGWLGSVRSSLAPSRATPRMRV